MVVFIVLVSENEKSFVISKLIFCYYISCERKYIKVCSIVRCLR